MDDIVKTINYNLLKPDVDDNYDINVQNGNMDIIDTQLKSIADAVAGNASKLEDIEEGAQVNRPIATQAQAEAGTDNTKDMTPLRTTQAIDSRTHYGETTGSVTALVLTLNPAPAALYNGFPIRLKLHIATGTNPTLTVNGSTAYPLYDADGNRFVGDQGKIYEFVYDSMNNRWQQLKSTQREFEYEIKLKGNVISSIASTLSSGREAMAMMAAGNYTDGPVISMYGNNDSINPGGITFFSDNVGTVRIARNGEVTIPNQLYIGTGAPNGVVTANIGAIYMRKDGTSASTVFYVKTSGDGTNNGWTAK